MRTIAFVLAALVLQTASAAGSWPVANGSVSSRRAVTATTLDARTIGHLRIGWSFRFPAQCNRLRRDHGESDHRREHGVSCRTRARASTPSPPRKRRRPLEDTFSTRRTTARTGSRSSAARDYYGATDTIAFALDAATGKTALAASAGKPVRAIRRRSPPIVDRGRVYSARRASRRRGAVSLYALAVETGRIVWRFQTIDRPWPIRSGGRRRRLEPGQRRRRGNVYAGDRESGAVGWVEGVPEWALFDGPARSTPTR